MIRIPKDIKPIKKFRNIFFGAAILSLHNVATDIESRCCKKFMYVFQKDKWNSNAKNKKDFYFRFWILWDEN